MKKLSVLFAVSLAVITLWSCKNNSSSNPISSSSPARGYFPLAVGNTWVSSIYQTDTTDSKIIGAKSTITDSITAVDSIDGRIAYAVTEKINGLNVASSYLSLSNNGDIQIFIDTTGHGQGAWDTYIPLSQTNVGVLNILYQLSQNISIVNSVADTTYTTDTLASMNLGDSSVTVKAGTFRTTEYVDSLADALPGVPAYARVSSHIFFTDSVGVVQLISYNAIVNNSVRYNEHLELVSYHVK